LRPQARPLLKEGGTPVFGRTVKIFDFANGSSLRIAQKRKAIYAEA